MFIFAGKRLNAHIGTETARTRTKRNWRLFILSASFVVEPALRRFTIQ